MSPDARAAVAFLRTLRAELRREFRSLTGVAGLAAVVAFAAFLVFVMSISFARGFMIPLGVLFLLALVLAIWTSGRGSAMAATLDNIEESLANVLRVVQSDTSPASGDAEVIPDRPELPHSGSALTDGS